MVRDDAEQVIGVGLGWFCRSWRQTGSASIHEPYAMRGSVQAWHFSGGR
jgi:hypothetical protein